jgi:polyisoprenoid-binding protein YceI
MKRALVLAASLTVMLAGLAFAEVSQFKFDPNHSEAKFSIRHFFTNVEGRFNTMSGTIQFDDKNWADSSVEATIDANSISTNNSRRDDDLRGDNFFDVANYPTITFKSTKVTKGEGNAFTIEGDLTMRGVTKKVTLDATFLGVGEFGRMGTKAGFTATTKLNRQDYGIKWNRTFDNGSVMLGDDVAVTLNIEANKVTPDAAAGGSK